MVLARAAAPSQSRPREPAVARPRHRLGGLVCLAAGASLLAACRTASSPALFDPPHRQAGAQATAWDDTSTSAQRSTGTPGPPSTSRTNDPQPGTARPSDATGTATPAVAPGSANPWRDDAPTCGPGPVASCCDECPERSFAVAAGGIVGFEVLLNQYDRHVVSAETYGTDGESILRNLGREWRFDEDPFRTNQFQHPYGGSIYHGFARSAGFDYWQSLGFDFAGSALWEIAGETDPPSINDQITTPLAGSFLGEALFRTANLMLESNDGRPNVVTKVGAALVCPSAAFNRYAYGDRFDVIYPSHDPAVFWSWSVGARRNARLTDIGVLSGLNRDVAVAEASLDYGLPGKCGYTYDRPFDYFHLEATATSSENALPESIAVRGLLLGTDYSSGPKYRAIWGLYGSYDYFSPEIFRVSSTALSIGTTGQYLASDNVALQGSLLAGIGFTASGTAADSRAERGYRYSASPQALVALRAVYRDIAMLDLTVNDFFLGNDLASSDASKSENVLRARMTLTVRVHGRHAIGLQFTGSYRDPSFSDISDSPQSVGAISLFYTHLSDEDFGVVR